MVLKWREGGERGLYAEEWRRDLGLTFRALQGSYPSSTLFRLETFALPLRQSKEATWGQSERWPQGGARVPGLRVCGRVYPGNPATLKQSLSEDAAGCKRALVSSKGLWGYWLLKVPLPRADLLAPSTLVFAAFLRFSC